MKKEAAAEAGLASVTPGSMEVLPRIDAGDPPPPTVIAAGIGEQSTAEAVDLNALDLSSVPTYDAFGMDDNIPGSPTGSLRARPSDSVGGIIDRQLQAGALPNLSIDPDALVNPYKDGSFTLEGENLEPDVLQPDTPLPLGAIEGGGLTGSPITDSPSAATTGESPVTTIPLSDVMNVDSFEGIPTQTAADRLASYRESIQSGTAGVIDATLPDGDVSTTWDKFKEFFTPEGTYTDAIMRKAAGAAPGAGIILGSAILKAKKGNLTASVALRREASSAESKKMFKDAKANIKSAKKELKNVQSLYDRRKARGGDLGDLGKKLEDAKQAVINQKESYKDLVIDRRFRAAGKVGVGLGMFVLAIGATYAAVAGEDAATELMYELIEGNPKAVEIAVLIAERTKTPFDLLMEEVEKPDPFSDSPLRRKLGGNTKTKNIMDETLPSVDVGQGDYYGRDADRESSGMQDWYDQQAREQKRTQAPRTSIRKRSDIKSTDESAGTFDDLINWVTSLGSSVVPEAAANADVPIESIGLAREVPEMVLNNPRVGIGPKISATESNGLYDAVGYNTVTDEARPPDPMVNTGKWADVRAKYGDTLGIGKYQFTNDFLVDIYAKTLNKSKKDAQIFLDNQVFKESVQEQALALAFGYLGLEDVIRGKMSAKRFVDKVEGRWHGIAKAIEEDPNYKQVMIDDLEGMVEQATGRTFSFSKSN